MKHKKIFLVGLLLLAIITIGAVSATEALAVDDSGGALPDDSIIVENGGGVADDSSDSSSKNVLSDDDDDPYEDDDDPYEDDDDPYEDDDEAPIDTGFSYRSSYETDFPKVFVSDDTINLTVDIYYEDDWGEQYLSGAFYDIYLNGEYYATIETQEPDWDDWDDCPVQNTNISISGIKKGMINQILFVFNGTEDYEASNSTIEVIRYDYTTKIDLDVRSGYVGENNTVWIYLYDSSKELYVYDEYDEPDGINEDAVITDKEFEVLVYEYDEEEYEYGALLFNQSFYSGPVTIPTWNYTEGSYYVSATFKGDEYAYAPSSNDAVFYLRQLYPYISVHEGEFKNGTSEVRFSSYLTTRWEDWDDEYIYDEPIRPLESVIDVYLNGKYYATVNCNNFYHDDDEGSYLDHYYGYLNMTGFNKGDNIVTVVYNGTGGDDSYTGNKTVSCYSVFTSLELNAPYHISGDDDAVISVALVDQEDGSIINKEFNLRVYYEDDEENYVDLVNANYTSGNITVKNSILRETGEHYFRVTVSFADENLEYSPSYDSSAFYYYNTFTDFNIVAPEYEEGEDYTFFISIVDEKDEKKILNNLTFDVLVYSYDEYDERIYLIETTVTGSGNVTIPSDNFEDVAENYFVIRYEFYDETGYYSENYDTYYVYFEDPEPVDEEINDITFDGPPCDGTIIEITDEELIIGYVLIPEWDDTVVGVNMTVNGKLVYVNSTATMEKEYLPLMEAYRYAVYMNFSHIKDKDIFVFQLDCYDDDVYWVYVAKVVGNNLVFYDGYSDEINYYVFYGNTTTKDLNDPEAMGPHPNGHFLELEIPDSCGITEGTVTISDGSKTLYTKSLSEIKEGYSYFVLGNSYAINLTDFDFSILPENKNVTVTFSSANTTLSEKRIRIGDYVYLVNTPERIAEYFNITVADEKLIYGTDTVISIIGTDQLNPQSAVIDAGGGYFNVYVNGERIEDLGSLFEFDDEEEEYIPTELELGILGFREYRYFYLSLDDLGIFEDGKYNIRVTQYPGDADSTDHELSEYFYSTETEVLNKNVTVKFITLTNVVTPELFKYYVDKYGTLTDEFDELTFVGNFSNISCKYLGITSPVTLIGQDAYFEDLFFEIAEDAENVTIRNLTLNYIDAINTPISVGELSKFVLEGNTINYDCKYHHGRAIASDAKDVSIINNRIYAYGGNTIADYNIGEKSINAIIIWGADKATVDNNILTAEADDYTSYGIRVYNSQGVTISNNVIAADLSIDLESSRAAINNNGIEGYMIVSGYNNTITYNNITTSAEYAIDLTDYTGNIVTNNNLFAQKTGNEAVKVNNDKNTIADNNVAKISTISLSDIVFDYGDSGSTTAVIANATGITDVKVLDKLKNPVNATISVNGLKITVSGLDAGAYTLSATTVPATDYEASTATADITVNKVDSTLNADNIAFVYGQSGSTTVSYTGADDVSAVIAGHADSLTKEGNVITVSNLDAGVYVLTVATIADANHNSVSRDLTVNVSKAQSTLSVDNITFIFDEVGKGTVNYTGAIGVTAEIFNYPEASVTVNGNEITVSGLDTGKYKLIVTTTVDANHESVSEIADVTVNRIPSTISVTDSVSFNYGSSGTVDVAYTGATGVTASVTNHSEAVISITNSSVTVSGLAAGNYVLVVSTAVDGNHISASKSSNITVKKLSTTITASKVTATYAVSKNLVITLKANGKALSGKSVTVTVGSIKKTLKTNSKGQVSVQVSSLVPKTYTATVKFAGDANYTGTSKKVTVVVKKNTPKITAKTKSFKRTQKTKSYAITIKNSKNKSIKGLKAYIKVNGVTYSATTNAKGVATFKINKLTKKGSYTSTITVKATKYYNKVTKKVTIKAT